MAELLRTSNPRPVAPFDVLADTYDEVFTRSLIGRAQRSQVWKLFDQVFVPGQRIVELNCGTGEDALFLARRGIEVTGCDSSSRMIEVATARKRAELPKGRVEFRLLATEQLDEFAGEAKFDGAFSNFGGLNCVRDLNRVAADLEAVLKPCAPVVLCLANRTCAWEMIWYALHGQPAKAFRRLRNSGVEASLGSARVHVWYPKINEITAKFSPWFRLRSYKGVGVSVPPSYLEHWSRRHSSWLRACEHVDEVVAGWPIFRGLGDHILLHFERNGERIA